MQGRHSLRPLRLSSHNATPIRRHRLPRRRRAIRPASAGRHSRRARRCRPYRRSSSIAIRRCSASGNDSPVSAQFCNRVIDSVTWLLPGRPSVIVSACLTWPVAGKRLAAVERHGHSSSGSLPHPSHVQHALGVCGSAACDRAAVPRQGEDRHNARSPPRRRGSLLIGRLVAAPSSR